MLPLLHVRLLFAGVRLQCDRDHCSRPLYSLVPPFSVDPLPDIPGSVGGLQ